MKRLLTFLFVGFILIAAKHGIFHAPQSWPPMIYDFQKNPLTDEKILLGRALFYDPLLSADNTISCASCHSPYSSFTHVDHSLSHGIHDSIGTRNSPALINLAWQKSFMWDGAIHNLDMQALAPISHPDEMGSSINIVVEKLSHSAIYPSLFKNAFGDSLITGERTLKAISQFLLTLVSSNSKYDKVIRGEQTFTMQESRGYDLFVANCSSCHKEPLFTNDEFMNNGLPADSFLLDRGRMKITGLTSDSLKFKVPTLRNIEFTYPYMHDGRFKKLSEVINHYTNGVVESSTLSSELKRKIILSSNEKVDLMSFLLTLTDRDFVFDPKHQYPKDILTIK